jgi:hypothetical protein
LLPIKWVLPQPALAYGGHDLWQTHGVWPGHLDMFNLSLLAKSLVYWVASGAAFYSSCYIQQTYFRSPGSERSILYGAEVVTCSLFLIGGYYVARKFSGPIMAYSVSAVVGVGLAGLIIASFLIPRHPAHGEMNSLFFILPTIVLVPTFLIHMIFGFLKTRWFESGAAKLSGIKWFF